MKRLVCSLTRLVAEAAGDRVTTIVSDAREEFEGSGALVGDGACKHGGHTRKGGIDDESCTMRHTRCEQFRILPRSAIW